MSSAPAPDAAPDPAFDAAFARTVGIEGGYTADPADPGNWTGGARGRGACRGTNWGISAAAYPLLDIAHLSRDAARAIYRRDYWAPLRADQMPPALAALAFDAAVNNGLTRARQWLRLAAAEPGGVAARCCEFQARRLAYMGALPLWPHAGLGWSRRLCRTLADAMADATEDAPAARPEATHPKAARPEARA